MKIEIENAKMLSSHQQAQLKGSGMDCHLLKPPWMARDPWVYKLWQEHVKEIISLMTTGIHYIIVRAWMSSKLQLWKFGKICYLRSQCCSNTWTVLEGREISKTMTPFKSWKGPQTAEWHGARSSTSGKLDNIDLSRLKDQRHVH